MKKIFIAMLILLTGSCQKRETEIIRSNVMGGLHLIKNAPKDDSLTKKMIKDFLLKNVNNVDYNNFSYYRFYRYTSKTKYFLKNQEDPGGFSSELLSYYDEDRIAVFSISDCKNDITKKVGQLYFFNQWGDPFKPDTIIYKCD